MSNILSYFIIFIWIIFYIYILKIFNCILIIYCHIYTQYILHIFYFIFTALNFYLSTHGLSAGFFSCVIFFLYSVICQGFAHIRIISPQLSVYYRSLNCSPAIAAPENRMKSFILRHLTFEPWHPLSNVSHFPLHHLHFWRKVSPKERMSSGKKKEQRWKSYLNQ